MVLDTNVQVRALASPNGPAAAVFGLLRVEHIILTSEYLLAEITEALRYDWVRPLHGLDDSGIEAVLQDLGRDSESVAIPILDDIPSVSVDRDDDPIIATAVDGHANVLCTLDKHLRAPAVVEYCRQHGIEVLTDVELLSRLRVP